MLKFHSVGRNFMSPQLENPFLRKDFTVFPANSQTKGFFMLSFYPCLVVSSWIARPRQHLQWPLYILKAGQIFTTLFGFSDNLHIWVKMPRKNNGLFDVLFSQSLWLKCALLCLPGRLQLDCSWTAPQCESSQVSSLAKYKNLHIFLTNFKLSLVLNR